MCTAAYLDLEKMIQSYIKSPSLNLDVKRLETRLAELPDEIKLELITQKDGECKPIQCAIARSRTEIITALSSRLYNHQVVFNSNINRINTPPSGQPFMATLEW